MLMLRGALLACLVASLTLLDSYVEPQDTRSKRQAGLPTQASPSHLRVGPDDELVSVSAQDADSSRGRRWVFSMAPTDDHASSALASPDTDETIEHLSVALASNDAKVRLKAVSALATLADIDSKQAGPALADAALNDRDSAVRQEAVFALGEAGRKPDMQVLEQALLDPDDRVREAAIEAFTRIGGDESAQALATAMHDKNASLRREAVDALGEIGGQTAIRLLQQATLDEQIAVRESAAGLLAELAASRS